MDPLTTLVALLGLLVGVPSSLLHVLWHNEKVLEVLSFLQFLCTFWRGNKEGPKKVKVMGNNWRCPDPSTVQHFRIKSGTNPGTPWKRSQSKF